MIHFNVFVTRILILSFMLSLLNLPGVAGVVWLYSYCKNGTIFTRNGIRQQIKNGTNFTSNGIYQQNLNSLLSFLSSNASQGKGFYYTTAGQDPSNMAYGLFLCRGDVVPLKGVCQECVLTATKDIVQYCPKEKASIIWYDECMLRYSNESFFYSVEEDPAFKMVNAAPPVNESERLMGLVATTMTDVATRAANDRSGKRFDTEEVNFTSSQTLYTLVQCTQDLSVADCSKCLREAIGSLPQCCYGRIGGRIIYPSCIVRYEMHPFYRVEDIQAPPPSATTGDKRKIRMILLVVGIPTVLIAILVGSCLVYLLLKRRKVKGNSKNGKDLPELLQDLASPRMTEEGNLPNSAELPVMDLTTIREATDNFSDSNKLGRGGFGTVYKGVLADGKEIAVKRLSKKSCQGLVELKNEIILIAKLQHRNLVRLLGCSIEGEEKLLIYEFMPNKSLDFFLFDSSKGVQLDWQRRLSIINGIARGLLYLHEDSRLRVIHRDLKAGNILLDHEMNPKISDFGMARIFGRKQSEANTDRVVGTFGYIAPEYAMQGLLSVKSDIFSFGVLLLEIISGKKNSGFFSDDGESLLIFAWNLWSKNQGLELMDPLLVNSCVEAEVLKCIQIGLLCVQDDPADRPTMSLVVLMLRSDPMTLPQPTKHTFAVKTVAVSKESSLNHEVFSANELTVSDVSPR
ncbi:cysteine-rich receptor-like protein kinase 15 [Hevea brasiliensis]|uniref:cysteine-rich receptor-like protein kinase 15 n=1 Tax=Hevea brasiliensis TaxID=3981 RepID=UPI0025F62CDD|nr:cysteine-rich receptor-like protein kinase 15 [Hevea brasiliensis]